MNGERNPGSLGGHVPAQYAITLFMNIHIIIDQREGIAHLQKLIKFNEHEQRL